MALNLRARIRYFREHRFVQNFAILQFGNLGNIVQAIVGIFLVRLLKPEAYGLYALAFSLAGLMTVVLGLGAQDAVTTIVSETYARKDKDATREALSFLAWSTVILGLISIAGSFLAPWLAGHWYHNSTVGFYASIIIIASVISTLFYSFAAISLQVVGRYKALTALGLADQLTRTGLSLLFVFLGFGVLGAVAGHFVGALLVFFISLGLWEGIKTRHEIFPSIRGLFAGGRKLPIKKYFGFSFWIAVDRNIANLYNILPVSILGLYVVATQITYFKLAFGYINLALSFLGPISTILAVEFPKIKVEESGRLARNFVKVSLYSCAVSLVITAAAILVSPIAFHILYGKAVTQSVPLVAGLFVYGALYGIGVGLGPMWRAINQVRISILINTVTLGIGIPLGLYLIKHHGAWGAVIMVTLWYSCSHVYSFFYLTRKLKRLEVSHA